MKKHEEKLTLRFNTCLTLINNIEDVVNTATKTWKNIYYLHKLSDFSIQVEEKEEEEEEEEEEEIQIDYLEEEEKDVTKEGQPEVQRIEETNPKKIAPKVIASLPHSPIKSFTPYSLN